MNDVKSAAFTGHRPTRFKFKHKEDCITCVKIKKRMQELAIAAFDEGVRRFYVGGALGTDMWAGEMLLELKKIPKYSEIQLICAIPFVGHDSMWDNTNQIRLKNIMVDSDKVEIICDNNMTDAYRLRNYWMVDHSEYLIAVYDNEKSIRSGTGQTVNYARKKGLRITFIHPDNAEVTLDTRKA